MRKKKKKKNQEALALINPNIPARMWEELDYRSGRLQRYPRGSHATGIKEK